MDRMKILLITQARIGSTRFPNKVTMPLDKSTLLGVHLERVKKAKNITEWVVATTNEDGVIAITDIAYNAGVSVYRGALNDVLDRFYHAALPFNPDYIVRVTSDCPLLDPNLIDAVIEHTISLQADYGANIFIEEFPDGQDVEVFTFTALKKAWKEGKLSYEREHVTPYIRNNSSLNGGGYFNSVHYSAPSNFNHIRMTVDQPKDLETIEILISKLGLEASWEDYTEYIINNIHEFKNQDIIRNEGYLKSLNNDQIK
jgi:spore coat polysaccharide biosynthesis protein SpsF